MGKSKEMERLTAHNMFVKQGMLAKEIAVKLKVTEKTVGNWIAKSGWKAERDAEHNSAGKRIENIKRVISNLVEERLEIEEQARKAAAANDVAAKRTLDIHAASIALQVANWNKALASLDKQTRITLEIYLEVMDDIFSHLNKHDNSLYLQTIDFQQLHLETISIKLG